MKDHHYANGRNAVKITAADVQPGDVIAGDSYRLRYFIPADAFRTVQEVEQLPDTAPEKHAGKISIRYTTARGDEFTHEYDPAQPFQRVPHMPDTLPSWSELENPPAEMPEQTKKRLEQDRDSNAWLAADYLNSGDVERATTHARQFREAQDKLDVEHDASDRRRAREVADIEAAGGHEHDGKSDF